MLARQGAGHERRLYRAGDGRSHGGERTRSNLDVSTREDLLRGGDHGPAIVPGDPDKSLLIRAVRYQGNLHMPPRGKLEDDKLADLADNSRLDRTILRPQRMDADVARIRRYVLSYKFLTDQITEQQYRTLMEAER